MTIQYCSDLHLEFRGNKQYLLDNPLKSCGEVLLLAGDIVLFAEMDKHAAFFDFIADHFEMTYWIPGNHEYYRSDLADRCGSFHEKIRDNVALVNNVAITRNNVRFVFSTLWSHISTSSQWTIQQSMSDFHVIKYKDKLFTPADYNEQHKWCLNFLKTELKQKVEKTIVVSHHAPTFMNYPEKYKGDVLNEAFASEQFNLIEASTANYWIYGHHHQSVPLFEIGSTKLICNQLGYVHHREHVDFKLDACIVL
ncbi:MAG: metallophosphoesterase [Cyclobacteriaceae bacterium]